MLYFGTLFQPHDKLRCSSGLDTGRLLCHSEEGSVHAVHHWNNSVFCCYLHLFNHHSRVKVNLFEYISNKQLSPEKFLKFYARFSEFRDAKTIIHFINFLIIIFKFFLHNIP